MAVFRLYFHPNAIDQIAKINATPQPFIYEIEQRDPDRTGWLGRAEYFVPAEMGSPIACYIAAVSACTLKHVVPFYRA